MPKFGPALIATLTAVALVTFDLRYASGKLTCSFKDKESTATIQNNNTFQKTCKYECIFLTEGNEHINKGAHGLNPGESHSQPATAKAKITKVKSQMTDCEK
jgi:hypothetical protein